MLGHGCCLPLTTHITTTLDDIKGCDEKIRLWIFMTRSRERSGYLYKQDSNQRAWSWTKRWVVFNGDTLRYFEDNKSMVSKRVIPVVTMINVENDIKMTDSRQFRFKLTTPDRVYVFATDEKDDLFLWTNTLMEAIMSIPKVDSLPEGLDMNSPDKEGFLKIEGMKGKVYVVVKQDKLCYYKSLQDYKVASPVHEIDLRLCSAKDSGKNRITLVTNYRSFNMFCDNAQEAQTWKSTFEEAIAESLSDTGVVEQLCEIEDNKYCVDCKASDPVWGSINMGIVMCKRCAGVHRQLYTPVSKIKSMKLDTKVWSPTVIKLFRVIGNTNANEFWCHAMPPAQQIAPDCDDASRQAHISAKYQKKQFCDLHPLHANMQALDEALCESAQTDDLLLTMRLVFSGANTRIITSKFGDPMTSYQLAKKAGKTVQAEFLYQNGGDDTDGGPGLGFFINESDNYRRRAVFHKGYLQKTGSNQKDFLRRWCVLEHCALSYYADEKATTAKDTIDNKDMVSLARTSFEKYEHSFTLTSMKDARQYLFCADSEEERTVWMTKLAQSFCPVDAISQIEKSTFTRAGLVFLKDGSTGGWNDNWLQLEGKVLSYFDKTTQQFQNLDLRKLIGISKREDGCCPDAFERGVNFVVDFPDRHLFIQGDLTNETTAWYSAVQKAACECTLALEDQQLTSANIPVIIDKCFKFIDAHGLRVEGIYRKAGQNSKVDRLLSDFMQDARSQHIKPEEYDVHDVANCLRRYLRNLNDPLLTKKYHKRWTENATIADHGTKLQMYKYLLCELHKTHPVNYNTLKLLILHLKSVSEYEAENKMSVTNLATLFGPASMNLDTEAGYGFSTTNQEIATISNLITYSEWLFDVNEEEKKIQDKIRQAEHQLKNATSVPALAGDFNVGVYIVDKTGECVNIRVPATMLAVDVVKYVQQKQQLGSGNWALFELLCNGELERVVHYKERVLPVILSWSYWSQEYCAGAYLCVKENYVYRNMEMVGDSTLAKFSDLKYSDKKNFKKFHFEFKQAKLAYYKSSQCESPLASWNIENVIIYLGVEERRSPPTKHGFTFINKEEKITKSKETPFFGRSICFSSEEELYQWLSSLMNAQNPDGLSVPRSITADGGAPGHSLLNQCVSTPSQRTSGARSALASFKTKSYRR